MLLNNTVALVLNNPDATKFNTLNKFVNKTNKKSLLTLILISSIFSLSYAQLADIDSECTDIKTNLRLRSSDNNQSGDVRKLQKYLFENKFLNISPTGFFGSKTKQAVSDYQKSINLLGTGFVGTLTRAEIKKDTCDGGVSDSGSVSAVQATNTQAVNAADVQTNTIVNVTNTNTQAVAASTSLTRPTVTASFSKPSILSSESSEFIIVANGVAGCNVRGTDLASGLVLESYTIAPAMSSRSIYDTKTYYGSTPNFVRGTQGKQGIKVIVECSTQAYQEPAITVEKILGIAVTPENLTVNFSKSPISSLESSELLIEANGVKECNIDNTDLETGSLSRVNTIYPATNSTSIYQFRTYSKSGFPIGVKGVKVSVSCSHTSGATSSSERTLNVTN